MWYSYPNLIDGRAVAELIAGIAIFGGILYGLYRFGVNEARAEQARHRHPTARKLPNK